MTPSAPATSASERSASTDHIQGGLYYLPDGVDPDTMPPGDVLARGGLVVQVNFNSGGQGPLWWPTDGFGHSAALVDVPGAVDTEGWPGQALVVKAWPDMAEVTWNVVGGSARVYRVTLWGNFPASELVQWARTAFRTRDGVTPG